VLHEFHTIEATLAGHRRRRRGHRGGRSFRRMRQQQGTSPLDHDNDDHDNYDHDTTSGAAPAAAINRKRDQPKRP
jgi:hypothetical protein